MLYSLIDDPGETSSDVTLTLRGGKESIIKHYLHIFKPVEGFFKDIYCVHCKGGFRKKKSIISLSLFCSF